MKLATLKNGKRDGELLVVSRDLSKAARAKDIAPTLQAALDDWERCAPDLAKLSSALEKGGGSAIPLDPARLMAPLPRAFQWADASAYLSHVERVRKARGAELPPDAEKEPLIYQGGSDSMIGPRDAVIVADEAYGIDLEAEVGVILGDVPMGTRRSEASRYVRLIVILNDVSLRNLTAAELAKGFGFFQSKAWTAFSPVAVTPDELGPAWDGSRVHLPLLAAVNGVQLGKPNAGEDMSFDFPRLIEHAAKTRPLGAGTILGSGTVSNRDPAVGVGCLAEKRALETIEFGKPRTPFLKHGDVVRIEMLDARGASVFGAIEQAVRPA